MHVFFVNSCFIQKEWTLRPNFFYSFRLEMKMMQIYFGGAAVPLCIKILFLKNKVEVGKLKKTMKRDCFCERDWFC